MPDLQHMQMSKHCHKACRIWDETASSRERQPWCLLGHLQALDALEHGKVVPGRRHGLNLDI